MRFQRIGLFVLPVRAALMVAALLMTVLLPSALFAEEESFQFTPVSAAGSGGAHTAAEDGIFTLLGNPALLNSVTSSMFFALSGGIRDAYRNEALEISSPPMYYTASGPLALGAVSKGVGFGVFDHLRVYSGGMDMNVIAAAGIDWTIINTASVKLDFGLAPKAFYRYRLTSAGVDSLLGASITPGILFSLGSRFSVGMSCDEAIAAAFPPDKNNTVFSQIPRSLNAGIAAGIVSNGTLGLTFFADYRDLLRFFGNDAGDPIQGIGVGLRAEFWNNFWLSAGMSNSAPTGGFGLNLGAVKLDIALFDYGVEAGIRIMRE
ncbi:MAG: hypothetical protein LBG27_08645 [Spirochaetaceae bacterium]|jgi:hypothetical protein|nr:hypothetical protein [Spirochaetaceae bacterium]